MDPSDQNVQSFTDAWATNIKALFDQHLEDTEQGKVIAKGFSALALRQAEANHQIVLQMAQNGVALANLVNNATAANVSRDQAAASAWQNLVMASALTNPAELAETAIGAKVTEQVRTAVDRAFETATAAAAQASPLPQGTTGVAQGSMQATTAAGTDVTIANLVAANAAMTAQLAKLMSVVDVLLVRITGEEVKPLTTPAVG